MQEEKPKFAMTLAKVFVQKQTQKPIFGKPYIMTGAYWGVCTFLFQQCGLLGRLYSEKELVPFLRVFVAQDGKELTAFEYLNSMVSKQIRPLLDEASTFHELVALREKAKMKSEDTVANFQLRYGNEKLPWSPAAISAAEWAGYGGCLGLNEPDVIVDLFEASNKTIPNWKEFYELGIVSTPEQTHNSIEDAQTVVSEMFKIHCKETYPELLPILS